MSPSVVLILFLTLALGTILIVRSSTTIEKGSSRPNRRTKNRNKLTPFVIKSKYHKALRHMQIKKVVFLFFACTTSLNLTLTFFVCV